MSDLNDPDDTTLPLPADSRGKAFLQNTARALELTLHSILDARAARPASTGFTGPTPFVAMDPATIPTRAESQMARLASKDKHSEAVAIVALKWIGERLHESGGIGLMRDTLEAVANRSRSRGHKMLSIANSKWDGIGSWHS